MTGPRLLLVGLLLAPSAARAAEPICADPVVIYCNDFEEGWNGIEAEADARIVAGQVEAELDADGDGALWDYRFPGMDRVHARFYVRFDDSWDRPLHHFYAIHGDRDDDPWSCHGDAGCRPDGVVCLSGTTVDSREGPGGEIPGEPFFYTYHPAMSCDPGAICDNYADADAICAGCAARGLPCNAGPECCWGNHFDLNQGVPVDMGALEWHALETMVAANTPGEADGEMALWVDGTLVAHHTGILWRETPDLLLNHLVIWNYFPEATESHRIWFDDLVISGAPIGPRDAPPMTPDAAPPPGATGDAGGCGCRTAGSADPGLGVGAILALALLSSARRRRMRPWRKS